MNFDKTNRLDIWNHLDDVDQQKIEKLRLQIFSYARTHLHKIDIEDVENRIGSENASNRSTFAVTNWWLKRLLIGAKVPFDVDSAMNKFVEIFTFRFQWKVSQLTMENTLPIEFFQTVPFIAEGIDKKGNRLVITRFKMYRKLPQFDLFIKRATLYLIEKLDLEFEKSRSFNGLTLLMDIQDFNYYHTNLEMLNFLVQIGFKYPGNVRNILVYSLPWPLKVPMNLAERLVDTLVGFKTGLFHSIDRHTIHQFIDADQLPHFLNGTRNLSKAVPENALPLLEMAKLNEDIVEKNAQKIHDYVYRELL